MRCLTSQCACTAVAVSALLNLAGCSLPLSTDFGLDGTDNYISAEVLRTIRDERLTPLQVRALLGEPTASTADGKAMGYLQCGFWSVKCVDVVLAVPVAVRQCPWEECRQVGIWFDDTGHAIDTKSFAWDDRLGDCSMELWLSNRGEENCYRRWTDATMMQRLVEPAASGLALVAPGDSWAGVASIQQGDNVYFNRPKDGYVDWHKMLHLDPGRYEITYYAGYATHSGPIYRSDVLELTAGHRYQVRSDSCSSWTRERGCKSTFWSTKARTATFVWFEDVATGQVLGGSRTEPENVRP